jgi:uncharacterized protein with PQ loop repeat
MTIISDERGVAWGLTFFLIMITTAVFAFSVVGLVMDNVYVGFDSEYTSEYISPTGLVTADTLYNMFGLTIIIPLLVGVGYVIVRAIKTQDGEF